MTKYIVEIEVQPAKNPEQTNDILELTGGGYTDDEGNKYSLRTLPEVIAAILDTPSNIEYRRQMGWNIPTKPHKQPAMGPIWRFFPIYGAGTPQGATFWNRLDPLIRLRVRQVKEKNNERND